MCGWEGGGSGGWVRFCYIENFEVDNIVEKARLVLVVLSQVKVNVFMLYTLL